MMNFEKIDYDLIEAAIHFIGKGTWGLEYKNRSSTKTDSLLANRSSSKTYSLFEDLLANRESVFVEDLF